MENKTINRTILLVISILFVVCSLSAISAADNTINQEDTKDIIKGTNDIDTGNTDNEDFLVINDELSVNTEVSGNKITITVYSNTIYLPKDFQGPSRDLSRDYPNINKPVFLYVNGEIVGSKLTDTNGMAKFTYSANSSGTYFIEIFSGGAWYGKKVKITPAKIETPKKPNSKISAKTYKKNYKYKNNGQITGSKKFKIKINEKYKLSAVKKSKNISYKYNKKTNEITVTVKNLAHNKTANINYRITKKG